MADFTKEFLIRVRADIERAVQDMKKLTGAMQGQKKAARDAQPHLSGLQSAFKSAGTTARKLTATLGGLFSAAALVQFARRSIQAVRQAQSSYAGLQSIAEAAGIGINTAFQEASRLAADGLITVAESSRALQNLLSRGYSVDQAVQTILRLKDAAAFNRQASLAMGAAVVSATEGLKNENSILVDNAGVTKNVSILWKEYADQIGVSVKSLTQQQKVQAEVNGILRETAAQAGNAAKAAQGLEGNFARLENAQRELSVAFGSSIVPALTKILELGARVTNEWVKPFLGGIEIMAIKAGLFFESIGASNRDIVTNTKVADRQIQKVVQRYENGLIPAATKAAEANTAHAQAVKEVAEATQRSAQRIAEIKERVTTVIKSELDKQISAEEAASKRLEDIQRRRADVAESFTDLISQIQSPAQKAPEDRGVLDILRPIQTGQAALEEGDFETALANAEKARDVIAELAREGGVTNQFLTQQAERAAELADKAGAGQEGAALATLEAAQTQVRKLLTEIEALKLLEINLNLKVAENATDNVVAIIREHLASETFPINVVPVLQGGEQPTPAEPIPGFAAGGRVRGPGTGTSDSILARLSNGEYVMRRRAVAHYGKRALDQINAMSLPRFAQGGVADLSSRILAGGGVAGGGSRPINLFLNGERFEVSASDDVVQRMIRGLGKQALKRGSRA